MVVIYAEKPDMAEKIAAALGGPSFHKEEKKNRFYNITYKGKEYAVTWGYGHLCALADASGYNPEYKNWKKMPVPFFPDNYKVILNEKSKSPVKETYEVVNRLFHRPDVELIINATDYDREGELIFYYIYSYSGCSKPVMRVKLSSTTQQGLHEAFDNLMDSRQFAGLVSSAQCRSIADWVIGCNLTVALTLKNGSRDILSIGRVQTPTLAMVVQRDEEIRHFKPEDYFTVEGIFTTADGKKYKGVHKAKRFSPREEAEKVLAKCMSPGVVTKVEKSELTKNPPSLYSLDSIQMDANSLYGFTLDKTLNIIQKLYEGGFLTYPRTDSQFLPENMDGQILRVQSMLKAHGFAALFNADADPSNMSRNRKLFFNDAKVGSHYAIIPTEQPASGLSEDEEKIYGLIADSVIRMQYPAATFEKTKVITNVSGEEFLTNGSVLAKPGWMFVHGTSKEELLPDLRINQEVSAKCGILAKKTEPPKYFTDKTLLSAMISAGKALEDEELRKLMLDQKIEGIGTTATRAAIVKQLIGRKFLARNGNKIQSTETGRNLIHAIPIEEVKSAKLTAQCEKELNQVMNGQESMPEFLDGLYLTVRDWCAKVDTIPAKSVVQEKDDSKVDLMCPVCGSPLKRYQWGYGCSEYHNGCKFSVGKICGKMLTLGQMRSFLSREKIGPLSFKKNDGTTFEATLVLEKVEEDGKIVNYRTAFEKKGAADAGLKEEAKDIYARCPKCNGKVIKGTYGWECEKKDAMVPYKKSGRKIEPEMAEALFANGQTPVLDGFYSDKKQKYFAAMLVMKDGKVAFSFPEKK